jgi:hypothetical protein
VSNYLSEIRTAIRALHGCESCHVQTVPVKEVFRGETAWEGDVEVFTITGHAKAKRCYAWGVPKDTGEGWDITTVLEIPPVESPETAVKIAIAAAAKKTNSKPMTPEEERQQMLELITYILVKQGKIEACLTALEPILLHLATLHDGGTDGKLWEQMHETYLQGVGAGIQSEIEFVEQQHPQLAKLFRSLGELSHAKPDEEEGEDAGK